MKIAAWMVVLSLDGTEEYYIDMALKSIIDHVSGIFILDEGCTDNTIKIAREVVGDKVPLYVEYYPTNLPRFDPTYNEPHFRTRAVTRAEQVFKPDWLLKIDCDDVYTPLFFERLQQLEESGELAQYNSIRHSSERFVTPEYRTASEHALEVVDGVNYYDPHTHCWRSGLAVQYIPNPNMSGYLHCVLSPTRLPELWLPGIVNIHLHRSFGPKSIAFWREGGDVFEHCTPFNPRRMAPKWFENSLNMGSAVHTPYPWPDYILSKWQKWMVYD